MPNGPSGTNASPYFIAALPLRGDCRIMRSVVRLLVILPFPVILVAWAPVQPPQTDPAKETNPGTGESTAASVLLLERLGAVKENQSALTRPLRKTASTTAVISGEPKE